VNANLFVSATIFTLAFAAQAHSGPAATSCHVVQMLAQEHAQNMARRERLDHAGFAVRAARGARAENVAMGYASREKTLAQWRASPRHAANMRLPGCKAVASAVSRSGRHYWAMVIGK
jgi:uncharacterized protein YkwD